MVSSSCCQPPCSFGKLSFRPPYPISIEDLVVFYVCSQAAQNGTRPFGKEESLLILDHEIVAFLQKMQNRNKEQIFFPIDGYQVYETGVPSSPFFSSAIADYLQYLCWTEKASTTVGKAEPHHPGTIVYPIGIQQCREKAQQYIMHCFRGAERIADELGCDLERLLGLEEKKAY